MKQTKTVFYVPLGAVVALGLLGGCGKHFDKIGDIENNPSQYVDKDVNIAGEVTRRYELPLGISNYAAYRVRDDSGQIWVISHSGAPDRGDKVGVKGTVRTLDELHIPVVGDFIGDVLEEKERRSQ